MRVITPENVVDIANGLLGMYQEVVPIGERGVMKNEGWEKIEKFKAKSDEKNVTVFVPNLTIKNCPKGFIYIIDFIMYHIGNWTSLVSTAKQFVEKKQDKAKKKLENNSTENKKDDENNIEKETKNEQNVQFDEFFLNNVDDIKFSNPFSGLGLYNLHPQLKAILCELNPRILPDNLYPENNND
jgi:hypothetical protein